MELQRQVHLLTQLVQHVRNFRATNCLVDMCTTVDGRLGAFINLNTKIWDIAPVSLMLPEAGGRLTDLAGQPIVFRLDTDPVDRTYAVVGASAALHPQVLAVIRSALANQ
jgi:fructose-1,6-bisphosphatase/inositol monophosphatase family enzyme